MIKVDTHKPVDWLGLLTSAQYYSDFSDQADANQNTKAMNDVFRVLHKYSKMHDKILKPDKFEDFKQHMDPILALKPTDLFSKMKAFNVDPDDKKNKDFFVFNHRTGVLRMYYGDDLYYWYPRKAFVKNMAKPPIRAGGIPGVQAMNVDGSVWERFSLHWDPSEEPSESQIFGNVSYRAMPTIEVHAKFCTPPITCYCCCPCFCISTIVGGMILDKDLFFNSYNVHIPLKFKEMERMDGKQELVNFLTSNGLDKEDLTLKEKTRIVELFGRDIFI